MGNENILKTLTAASRARVAREKKALPLEELRGLARPKEYPFSFLRALQGREMAFICEVKKASPSKGVIAEEFPYLQIAEEYQQGGASAISVLTEPDHFLGSDAYLEEIKARVMVPVLRKDFIVDEYQIWQAARMGADAILLICAILTPQQLEAFQHLAHQLGLSCLVEVHDVPELVMALGAGAQIIGCNNRDLRTFEVDLDNSLRMRSLTPPGIPFVAESGIRRAADVALLRRHGVDGVLIGEGLMASRDRISTLQALRAGAHISRYE